MAVEKRLRHKPRPTDKVVVLARGLGTRMQRPDPQAVLDPRQAAVAETGLKGMIPLDRPFLDYTLTALADAGYRRVLLVVAPEHDSVREYYSQQSPPRRLDIELAVQAEPRGTADAVLAAQGFAGSDPFLVINADNYYPLDALRGLRTRQGPAVALFDREAMIAQGNIPAERVLEFAVARIDAQGFLVEIIEKPDAQTLAALPEPVWVSMNCWRFDETIFEACRQVAPSPRGELELPDAVQYAIDQLGQEFRAVTVRAAVLDLTCRRDIKPAAERLAGKEVNY
ncbi:MAG TPA: nucleotidyltransferase family protein [Planctomycetaceae bacterium]|nr:nucleotidyltransferase family protein [Planctomycetaceae bacterium]